MPDSLPPGPYRTLRLADGTEVPYYIIPFDEEGRCVGPQSRKHLIDRAGGYSDIFLFSHGWNNDWKYATGRYEHFINGFMKMRGDQQLPAPPGYKPLLVGIFWPSAVLVRDDETSPTIAASPDARMDAAVADEQAAIREIAGHLPAQDLERFYDLSQREALTEGEALELARILQPIYSAGQDELSTPPPKPEEMVAAWKAASPQPAGDADPNDFGTSSAVAGGPQSAGVFGAIRDLARNAIRGTTVWMMKDRAGTVGAKGVGPLLVALLSKSAARIHLIGHSYGGKVVLSALCAPAALPRKVHAVLLLQPAVSHLCFANQLPVRNTPGGYREALNRVERPIFSTFSRKDVPLTQTFHLALVRPSDLGEARIAAAAGEPPNWFAALGGFGPRRAGEKLVDMQLPPSAYALDGNTRIYGLRGDATIGGHGDISNTSTWWALHNMIRS
jgi:pimeloyl-ACP methyl ester carboxylesterase